MMIYIPRDSVNTSFDGTRRAPDFDPVCDPEVGRGRKWLSAFSDQPSARIFLVRKGPADGMAQG